MFASKCQGECHAVKAALCDLGDPGWGDPWFPHWAFVASHTLWRGPMCFVAGLFVLFLYGPASTWHKRCHFARNEMILSYHLQLIFSLINWNCHVTALCFVLFWCGLCFCLFLCFLFSFVFVVSCLVSWMSVTVHRTMYRSSTSLLLRPLQQRPLRELINQLIPTATCS